MKRMVQKMIEAGNRMDARQLIAGTEGNLSVRLEDGTILITASGEFKGRLTEESFVRVSPSGKQISGKGRPSSETAAHLACYELRPDVQSIVHTHAPHAVALMLRGWGLEAIPMAEAAYMFGSVPTTRFAVPGTNEGGEVVREWIETRDALLLNRHGALTVGSTLDEALARMEMLESVARSVLLAGGPELLIPLGKADLLRSSEAAIAAGVRREAIEAWCDALLKKI